jgi:hypothetical protein
MKKLKKIMITGTLSLTLLAGLSTNALADSKKNEQKLYFDATGTSENMAGSSAIWEISGWYYGIGSTALVYGDSQKVVVKPDTNANNFSPVTKTAAGDSVSLSVRMDNDPNLLYGVYTNHYSYRNGSLVSSGVTQTHW